MSTANANQYMTLEETARHERRDYETIRRWADRGVCGVTLETVSRGYQRYVAVEALERFHREVEEARVARRRKKDTKRQPPSKAALMARMTAVLKELQIMHGVTATGIQE
jgi:hypothetical protein